jgi:hypothetical protein
MPPGFKYGYELEQEMNRSLVKPVKASATEQPSQGSGSSSQNNSSQGNPQQH